MQHAIRTRLTRWVAVLAVTVGLIGVGSIAGARAASASTLACGSIVSQSVRLTSDMVCPGVALYVESSAPVVVNLAGHHITGVPGTASYFVGIFNDTQGTVIKNGTISGFTQCIFTYGPTYTAMRMSFANCDVNGIGHGTTIGYSVFRHATVRTSQDVLTLAHDRFVDGPGLTAVSAFETYTKVTDTFISGYATGVLVREALSSADLERNIIVGNGTGIMLGQGLSVYELNEVPGVVTRNVIEGNARDGIAVLQASSYGGYLVPPNRLSLTSNLLANNGGDGLRVTSPVTQTLNLTVGGNLAVHNRGNGIAVAVSPNIVLTDLGDRAVANANPQCIGVRCY